MKPGIVAKLETIRSKLLSFLPRGDNLAPKPVREPHVRSYPGTCRGTRYSLVRAIGRVRGRLSGLTNEPLLSDRSWLYCGASFARAWVL